MVRTVPKKKVVKNGEGEKNGDEDGVDSTRPSSVKKNATASVKRAFDDDDDSEQDGEEESPEYTIGNEMSSLIKKFENEKKKNLSAKRKRLETLTSQSASNCKIKVESILENQKKDRQTLVAEYTKQMNCLFAQWEADIAKVKENEEKLNNVLQQQMKLIAQIRVVQTQRFKSLKQLQEQYIKSNDEIEANHGQQKVSVGSDLKDEMARLQAKILKETQIQEMATMRQNLHSMLFK